MHKAIFNLFRLMWKTQKVPIVLFLIFQSALAIYLRTTFLGYLNLQEMSYSWMPQETLSAIMIGLAAIAFSVLLVTTYLSFLFHPYSQQAWMRRLPIPQPLFFAFPAGLLFLYSAALYFGGLVYWHGYAANMSFALLGFVVPFTLFGFMRSLRNPWVGFFTGLFFIGAVYILHCGWTWFWYSNQWRLLGELFYLGILAAILFVVERQNRIFPLALVSCLLLLLLAPLSYPLLRAPQSLTAAVSDVMYFPTPMAIARYRSFVLDEGNWSNQILKPSQRYFYNLNEFAAERFLSAEEKTQLLKIVVRQHDLFESKRDDDLNRTFRTFYPISPASVTESGEAFLLNTWRDENVYCTFLPMRNTRVFFEKIFKSNCGEIRINEMWGNYQPGRDTEFNRVFEDSLLQAHRIASDRVKRRIMPYFVKGANWDKDPTKKFGDTFLLESSIGPDLLAKWKTDFRKSFRNRIRDLASMDRTDFKTELMKIGQHQTGAEERGLLEMFCRLVSDNCEHDRQHEYFGLSLMRLPHVLALKPSFDPDLAWYKDQILKPEAWAKVQSLKSEPVIN